MPEEKVNNTDPVDPVDNLQVEEKVADEVDKVEADNGEDNVAGEMQNLLAAREKENEELFSRLQRLQADFENYKRRSRKELEDMAKYGTERLILGLLPVMDNFARALAAAQKGGDAANFMSGMEMILRQFKEALAKEGLQAIAAEGQPFDPEQHEAVMQETTANPEEDNIITAELQVGYTLHEKVVRPSMVKVAKFSAE